MRHSCLLGAHLSVEPFTLYIGRSFAQLDELDRSSSCSLVLVRAPSPAAFAGHASCNENASQEMPASLPLPFRLLLRLFAIRSRAWTNIHVMPSETASASVAPPCIN